MSLGAEMCTEPGRESMKDELLAAGIGLAGVNGSSAMVSRGSGRVA
jgi:hypothetical protein